MGPINVAVYLNADIHTNLRDDCLGGEWRWERQVLEALLRSDKISKVYSLYPSWRSSEAKPDKYIDGLPPEDMADTICLFYYSYHHAIKNVFKGVVLNTFQLPAHDFDMYDRFNQIYGSKWFLSYDAAYKTEGKVKDYCDMGYPNNFDNLPIPSVPEVSDKNNFNNNIILFPGKDVVGLLRNPNAVFGNGSMDVFSWVASKLAADDQKEFHILSGYCQADMQFRKIIDLEAEFFSFPPTKCLLPFRSRVVIHRALGWDKVLELYSKSKIAVSSIAAGGGPVEAASYGIPMPSISKTPMSLCEDYLQAELFSKEYFDYMDRLYHDEEYYIRVGSAQREFVREHYTYDAFVDKLINIFIERGMV